MSFKKLSLFSVVAFTGVIHSFYFFPVFAADLTHLQKLKKTGNCPNCNLSDANLSNIQLRNANLSGADLTNAILINASFEYVTFAGATLINADFTGVNANAYTSPAAVNFSSADLRGAKFIDARLIGSDFRGSNLLNVDFRGANLSGANLSSSNTSGADFRGTYLESAIMPDGSEYVQK